MRARWHVRVNALVVAWALVAAAVAVAHRAVPAAPWLMVHLLLLGAVSTAILIWSAHFAEAVRRRPLPGGPRGQAARLAGHTVGALLVVAGLLAERWPLVATGALAVGAVAVWHAVTLVRQGRGAMGVRLGFTAWYFVAAAGAMAVGAGLGALLARADLAGTGAARAYVAHVVVMMLGWVGLTVVGTLVTLWPTMLRVQLAPDATTAARHGLAVLGTGLLVVVAGAAVGSLPTAGAGVAVYGLGLLRTTWPLLVEARRRAPDTFASRSVAAAWLWLLLVVAVWSGQLLTAPGWAQAQAALGAAVGLLVVGFAAQVLAGSLCHLGPMVVGGGPAAVRASRALVERGGTARLVLTNGGLAVYLVAEPSLVRVGTSMLVLGALIATPFLLVRTALAARRRPRNPAPAMPPVELLTARRRPGGPGLAAAG
ncbi:copper oxidase, partial [Actinotalea ferrariae]|nr:copper oxidase [Actinotalea ferrariae]